MKEVTIHARAGQGAITVAAILGNAVFWEGKYALAFPHFGAARMGAPMNSFVRINDRIIRIRSQIYEPDYIMVVDYTLMRGFNVFQDIKWGGSAFINQPDRMPTPQVHGVRVYTIPADEISHEIFGSALGNNTVLLGAFAAGVEEVSIESLYRAIDEKFTGEIARDNKKALEEGFYYFLNKYS